MLTVGLQLVKSSIYKTIHPEVIVFNIHVIVILVISILTKLCMGLFTKHASKKINSSAITVNSLDSLCDAFVTASTLFSYVIAHFLNWQIDGYIGILMALIIFYSGLRVMLDTLKPLLGQSPDPKIKNEIKQNLLKNKTIISIHDLMLHNYGPNCFFGSVHVVVPSDENLMDLHNELFHAEMEIERQFNIYINIHPDPLK